MKLNSKLRSVTFDINREHFIPYSFVRVDNGMIFFRKDAGVVIENVQAAVSARAFSDQALDIRFA